MKKKSKITLKKAISVVLLFSVLLCFVACGETRLTNNENAINNSDNTITFNDNTITISDNTTKSNEIETLPDPVFQTSTTPTSEDYIILYNTAPVYQNFAKLQELNVHIESYTYESGLLPDEIHYSLESIDKSKIQKLQSEDGNVEDMLDFLWSFNELSYIETIADEIIDYLYEEDFVIDPFIWPENFSGFEFYGQVLSEDVDASSITMTDFTDYDKVMWYTKIPHNKTFMVISYKNIDRCWGLLYAGNGQLEAISSFDT